MSEIHSLQTIEQSATLAAHEFLAGIESANTNPYAWGTAAHEVWRETFDDVVQQEQGEPA